MTLHVSFALSFAANPNLTVCNLNVRRAVRDVPRVGSQSQTIFGCGITKMVWEALPTEIGEIIFQHATNSDLHMITSFSTVSKAFNAWNNLWSRLANCEETIQNFDFLQYMAKLERWDKEAEDELHHEECLQRWRRPRLYGCLL